MKIKVCGLKYPGNINAICEAGADLIGFIFYKDSPRFVDGSIDFDQVRKIRKEKVGVFVNEDMYSVLDKIAYYDLDLVQLHGDESPAYCFELKKYVKVIKAIAVKGSLDKGKLREYEGKVDYFLFDTATDKFGGSGIAFNHQILNEYDCEIPFILSGGLSLENIEGIKKLQLRNLLGLDINSRFETKPGVKDVNKVKQFIEQTK